MSTTVAVGDYTVTSTHEDAASMTEALKPEQAESAEPRVLVDKGKVVEQEPEKEGLSKAASELGKKGGEAAAKARQEAIKAKPIKDKKASDDKGSEEGREGVSDVSEEVAAPDGNDTPEETDGHKVKEEADRKSRAQQRVEEATRKAAAAERRAAELESRLDRMERSAARPAEATRPAEDAPKAKPKPEDYESYEVYLDARDEWNREDWTRTAQRQAQAHDVASRYAREVGSMVDGWQTMLSKSVEADPEFREKVKSVTDVVGWPTRLLPQDTRPTAVNWIADDLMSAPERAPALMLYLSEHPQDLQRIAALSSPRAITRELAKLEVRLDDAISGDSSSSRPASKPVSQAKPPVRPVTGSPHTADQELDDDSPLSAYVQRFGQRELQRSRR